MEQIFEQLSADDISRIEAHRNWVKDHYDPGARLHYETLEGKLRLLETIKILSYAEAGHLKAQDAAC